MRSLLLAILVLLAPAAAAQRAQAEVQCTATGEDFAYDCTIRLSRAGKPLAGTQVTVGADMPSMPMAHNIRPVQATPGDRAGEYRARLDLEMLGLWTVKLRLAGPLRDQLLVHLEFDQKKSSPAKRGAAGRY